MPSPVRNVQAVPGNGNAIVTWEPPSNTGGPSQTISQYKVTVTPTGGGSPITVLASAPRVLCPNGVNTDCYRLNISPLTNNTNYTIAVQAQNSVGLSDVHDGVNPDASATAMPSINAVSRDRPDQHRDHALDLHRPRPRSSRPASST